MSEAFPPPSAAPRPSDAALPYEAPAIAVLGSLADLTLGGTDVASADGWGGAGDSGTAGSFQTA